MNTLAAFNFRKTISDDFIYLNHRLENHPLVQITVYWKLGDKFIKENLDRISLMPDQADLYTVLSSTNDFKILGEIEKVAQYKTFIASLPLKGKIIVEKHLSISGKNRKSLYNGNLTIPMLDEQECIGALRIESNDYHIMHHYNIFFLLTTLLAYTRKYYESRFKISSAISINLGKALKKIREEKNLTQLQLADILHRNRITLSRWEGGAQIPSPGQLIEWCAALGLLDKSDTQVQILDISNQINKVLKDNPAYMSSLSPEQFEYFIAERISSMGYEVIRTGSTFQKDGGIDLIAYPKNSALTPFLIAVQIKHHKGFAKSGSKDVRDLLSHKGSAFRFGLLVTNTTFTKDARWLASQEAHKDFIRLRDFEDLKKWIQDNFTTENYWHEIPDEITLAPGITIQIPKPIIANAKEIWKDSGYKG